MQQDRNYRYAPTFAGGSYGSRRSQYASEQYPTCKDCCENNDGCTGGDGGKGCAGGMTEPMVLAMAYVLSPPFEKLYAPAEAIKNGTLFMKLNLPYGGRSW